MEGIHVHQIALPLQLFAARLDVQPHHVVNRPCRTVVPRNPLGIHQRDRPRIYGNGYSGVQDVAGCIGSINGQPFVYCLGSRKRAEQQDRKETGEAHDFSDKLGGSQQQENL